MDAGQAFRLSRELHELAMRISTDESERAEANALVAIVTAHIAAHPDSPIGAIASGTGVSQPAVSKVVATLVDNGVATVERDPGDARRTLVRLTASARTDLVDRGRRRLAPALVSRGLTTADAQRAERLLDELWGLLDPRHEPKNSRSTTRRARRAARR